MSVALRMPTSEVGRLSHMPFLARDRDEFTIIFARSDEISRRAPQYSRSGTGRIWKLHWLRVNARSGASTPVRRVETGLEANEVECSPSLCFQDGQVYLSFIGSAHHGTGPLEHYLYWMAGSSLEQLNGPVQVSRAPCAAGFYRPDLTALASGEDGTVRLISAQSAVLETSFAQIVRVSFCYDRPNRLLITGLTAEQLTAPVEERLYRTVLFDLAERSLLGELLVDGQPVYKPSLSGNALAYVVRNEPPAGHKARPRERNQIRFTDRGRIAATGITARLN